MRAGTDANSNRSRPPAKDLTRGTAGLIIVPSALATSRTNLQTWNADSAREALCSATRQSPTL